MDISHLSTPATDIPAALSIAGMGLGALLNRRYTSQAKLQQALQDQALQRERELSAMLDAERARRRAQYPYPAYVTMEQEQFARVHGKKQIAWAAVGTYAANMAVPSGRCFIRAGAGGFLGDLLLAEPDEYTREVTLRELPSPMRDGAIPLTLRHLPAGLKGATVTEGRALEKYFRSDLDTCIDEWIIRTRRDAMTVTLLLLLSPGGSACLAERIIVRYKDAFPTADVYVLTLLDHKTQQRESNTPAMFDMLEHTGRVNGYLILDNRQNALLFDWALAHVLPALVTSSWLDNQPQSGFNVLPALFREHRVATLRATQDYLPLWYEPAFEHNPNDEEIFKEHYVTDLSVTERVALEAIEAVLADPTTQSLSLPAVQRLAFLYCIAPIRPDPCFRTVARRVREGLKAPSITPHYSVDTTVSFASIKEPLQPMDREVPLTVVSLVPVLGGVPAVKQLIHDEQLSQNQAIPAAKLMVAGDRHARNGQRRSQRTPAALGLEE